MESIHPVDKFKSIVAVLRFSGRLLGTDVLDKDFKFNARTGILLTAIVMYYLFSLWIILENFADDKSILLDVSTVISCNTQGLVKLLTALRYQKLYYLLGIDVCNVYEKYQHFNRKYEQKLSEWNMRMRNILIAIGVIYFAVSFVVISIPVILYFYNGSYILVTPIIIPKIDPSTGAGVIITNGFNSVCVLIAGFGFYAADLYFIMFLTYPVYFYDVLALKIGDLQELVAENDKKKRKLIPALVEDILDWHKFYLIYNEKCNLVFYWPITVHMTCTIWGIVTTILIILLKDWPGAYAYLVVLFVWLYTYSVIGTRIEICNDKFCDAMYDINWYELPLPQQKTVLMMLLKSQLPKNIYFAGVVPLTVETALKITRTIYSVLMMALQLWD